MSEDFTFFYEILCDICGELSRHLWSLNCHLQLCAGQFRCFNLSELKKAIISVINDLVTDQRVDKTAMALHRLGFAVTLVGRRKRDSMAHGKREYSTWRMVLLFEKGPLFYAEYNIRLFFFLLFHKADLLISNDLDTLLANYLISRIKKIPIVYDSHEYFTGVPELVDRPFIQGIWKSIERHILPKLGDTFTVNESIAELYRKEYGIKMKVVRNIPPVRDVGPPLSRPELGLPVDKHIVILQGAGINIQRGAEEAVEAMQHLNDTVLLIVGGGDVIHILKEKVQELRIQDKVIFKPKQPFDRLMHYTMCAEIGLTLDKDTNINYRFSLPNKLFDYIHAGIPVLASNLVEIRKIIEGYDIGLIIDSHDPEHIASKIRFMLDNKEKRRVWKENLEIAADELCWDKEEKILTAAFKKYV
ncbi:MAG: glycosyltransferase [Bacteroidetes bacterium]|nr:glycosyltransferase [Bacteroidota bacterium]